MKKINLPALGALLFWGMAMTSCQGFIDSVVGVEDNPASGTEVAAKNISEPSDFEAYIDMSTYAGDSFYQYAVGKWLDENPLKNDEYSNGTMAEQAELSYEFVKNLAGSNYGTATGTDPVLTCLHEDYKADEFATDKAALKSILAGIDKPTTLQEMYQLMGKLTRDGYMTPAVYYPLQVERKVVPAFAFPEPKKQFKADYKTLMAYADMTMEDAEQVEAVAKKWKDFLVKQEAFLDKHQCCTPHRNLVKMEFSRTRGDEEHPLKAIFDAVKKGLGDVYTEDGYKLVDGYLAKMTLDELKLFCKYMVVNRDFLFMPGAPSYHEKAYGSEDMIIAFLAYKFCPLHVNISALYNQTVDPNNREAVMKMCKEICTAFKKRIEKRPWMSEATKQKAIEKLENMTMYVGWPTNENRRKDWKMNVPQNRSTAYLDMLDLFKQRSDIIDKKAGSTDESDLFFAGENYMPSYKANAFCTRIDNSITILSSNLKAPIFDPSKSDAYNYSVMGATTIGHEITHNFDSEGRKYNKVGKLENWWTAADIKTFEEFEKLMIDNFNGLTYYGNHKCDGKNTLAENIADLGGLNNAYDAFIKKQTDKGISGAELDRQGREFYRGFAVGWMENPSDEAIDDYEEDEHAPNFLRVDGNVYLVNEFYRLFNIQSGKMYLAPDKRIEIW